MKIGKAAPWLISVLFAIGAAVMWGSGKQKDEFAAEQAALIQKLTGDYNKLVNDANAKIAFANLPFVPVALTTSKGIIASGYVLQVRNTSSQTIAIKVSIERPADGKKKDYELTLDGGTGKNIGELEGWAFISGDRVSVTQAEHKPVEVSIT